LFSESDYPLHHACHLQHDVHVNVGSFEDFESAKENKSGNNESLPERTFPSTQDQKAWPFHSIE
jgi:hypothetical protein